MRSDRSRRAAEVPYRDPETSLAHITKLLPYVSGNYMIIDSSSRRNLELVETLREKQKRGSLLWVLDKTKTAMGARTLRSYLEQPLIDKEEIEKRLTAIEELNSQMITREELREYLNPIYDLERLIGRISYQTANPRDLIAFKASLEMLPSIQDSAHGTEKSADAGDSGRTGSIGRSAYAGGRIHSGRTAHFYP